jgi:hypothetical protein
MLSTNLLDMVEDPYSEDRQLAAPKDTGAMNEEVRQREQELKQAKLAIIEFFDEKWLELGSNPKFNHPLQQLWNRTDRLAETELFIFGNALIQCKKINSERTKLLAREVKILKENKRKGSIYGMCLAGQLCG